MDTEAMRNRLRQLQRQVSDTTWPAKSEYAAALDEALRRLQRLEMAEEVARDLRERLTEAGR